MPRSHRSGRSSLRARVSSLEMLEGRALLSVSAAPSHHPLPVHAAIHQAHTAPVHVASRPALTHAASTAAAHPLLVRQHAARSSAEPDATGGPPSSALTPAQTRTIYGFYGITNLGAGQTIAIVDAYDDPNIFADADVFDQQFKTTLNGTTSYYTAYGASTSWLTKAYSATSGAKPTANVSWGQEISLDVEWAHAIAPMAKILLVEAASTSFTDLLGGDSYAASHGATVISNSWGGGESSSDTTYDSTFATRGVTFVFSAGDSGNQSYPSTSPNVVSVGGTTLSHDASYNWTGESGWTSGGGGLSAYEGVPSYQTGLNLGYTHRATPDISYDSDPNTGFAVYDTYGANRRNPAWGQFGGTSDAAPQWSALIAIANEGRATAGKTALDGVSQTLPAIYAMTTSQNTPSNYTLYDVTSGSNSVGTAGGGYDLVTGRGTPRYASQTYAALVNA